MIFTKTMSIFAVAFVALLGAVAVATPFARRHRLQDRPA